MRIGIDLGGTKIEGIAIDEDGVERQRLRVPTPKGELRSHRAERSPRWFRHREGVRRKGHGRASAFPAPSRRPPGLVKNANTVELIGHPLDKDLSRVARPRGARRQRCQLLRAVRGHRWRRRGWPGGLRGHHRDRRGRWHRRRWHACSTGQHAIAGEWGHNPLAWPRDDERPGHPCFCGRPGCNESFLAGPSLARDHRLATGQDLKAPEIAERAESGDPAPLATMVRYEDRLARALAVIINVLDPDFVVLGGGVSNIARLYREVPLVLPKYVFSDKVTTPIVKAKYGDSSGVRGAAWLWPRQADADATVRRSCT